MFLILKRQVIKNHLPFVLSEITDSQSVRRKILVIQYICSPVGVPT